MIWHGLTSEFNAFRCIFHLSVIVNRYAEFNHCKPYNYYYWNENRHNRRNTRVVLQNDESERWVTIPLLRRLSTDLHSYKSPSSEVSSRSTTWIRVAVNVWYASMINADSLFGSSLFSARDSSRCSASRSSFRTAASKQLWVTIVDHVQLRQWS